MEIKVENLEWFEKTPETLLGRDKHGNEYIVGYKGEIYPVSKGEITPDMHGTQIEAVKQLIEREKIAAKNADT